jgi:hypothetical protein
VQDDRSIVRPAIARPTHARIPPLRPRRAASLAISPERRPTPPRGIAPLTTQAPLYSLRYATDSTLSLSHSPHQDHPTSRQLTRLHRDEPLNAIAGRSPRPCAEWTESSAFDRAGARRVRVGTHPNHTEVPFSYEAGETRPSRRRVCTVTNISGINPTTRRSMGSEAGS